MKLKREFVLRQIAGDHLLIPVGKTALDMNGMLTLNEMGAFLWKKLPQAQTEAELTDLVLAEYEADRATVEKDVAEFLDKLRKLGIL
ncbi:MAG: PqqD family protein [Firmicutes bacterium]|nr:PqqD family protein [Bacillota bacterium]